MAHGPSRSVACGIFPDQGSNPCPLHWQADSQPLRHQGSPEDSFLKTDVSAHRLTVLVGGVMLVHRPVADCERLVKEVVEFDLCKYLPCVACTEFEHSVRSVSRVQ